MSKTDIKTDALTKRIELHCHSKAGGNATMYAGELIRYASMMNMPAIAITDRSSILAFPEMEDVIAWGAYSARPIYGMEMLIKDRADDDVSTITILIKDETGKQNLYSIISETIGDMAYPVYDKKILLERREGLLIGSGAENGKLRKMAKDGATDDELRTGIAELDYVEILPYEIDRKINERLIRLCDEMNIPVVAVSDAHYLEKKDKSAWNVINKAIPEPVNKHGVHLLTTEEMLAAFSYLSEEKAQEIVIDNTHKIASVCGSIKVVPDDHVYPQIPNAGERLDKICKEALGKKYGAEERETAGAYLERELLALDNQGTQFYFLQLRDLLDRVSLRACDLSMRGVAAGSMVAYLLGISEVDPLKYNLIPERIYGKHMDRMIDVDVNVPIEMYNKVHKLIGELEGVGKALDVASTFTVSQYNADELVEKYEIEKHTIKDPEEREQICGKIMGNYTGRERGMRGMYLFPEGFDYTGVMPVQKYSDGTETAYYDSFHFFGKLFKADIYGHRELEALRSLSIRTGVDLADVPVDSDDVISLFISDEKNSLESCADIPELANDMVVKMIAKLKPTDFDDMVKIVAMSHGTGVWLDNGEKLVDEYGIGIKDLIADRDDIFEFLVSKGIDRLKAFDISEYVRKGKATRKKADWMEWKKELFQAGVPSWYMESCERIRYLFPRAHSVSYTFMMMRMAWFKVHFPKEYSSITEEFDF